MVSRWDVDGPEPVAINDENADCLALAPQRRTGDGEETRGARGHKTGPVGHFRIGIVQVGNVDLLVEPENRARQIAGTNPELRSGNFSADALGAGAKPDRQAPRVTVGDPDRDARGVKQPRGSLGDLLLRSLRIARSVGDGAQDVRAGVLTIPGGAQLRP